MLLWVSETIPFGETGQAERKLFCAHHPCIVFPLLSPSCWLPQCWLSLPWLLSPAQQEHQSLARLMAGEQRGTEDTTAPRCPVQAAACGEGLAAWVFSPRATHSPSWWPCLSSSMALSCPQDTKHIPEPGLSSPAHVQPSGQETGLFTVGRCGKVLELWKLRLIHEGLVPNPGHKLQQLRDLLVGQMLSSC